MGIIRNSANRKIKGRVGDMSYYVSKGLQIARQALNNSNYGETARRSQAQQARRVKWSNLVAFYKVSKHWMKKAFESKAKGQTDYNAFMSVNLGMARVNLTKAMAAVDACVVDAYTVSQGSLPSINLYQKTNRWATDIKLGALNIGVATSVADFSRYVILNNPSFREGDQISFVSYQQTMDAQDMPRVICTAYEVTLNLASTELLRDYLPEFCSQTDADGFLATGTDISLGGFAYVHSRNDSNGALLVSTQQIELNNASLIAQYTSPFSLKTAIASYGVDTDTFLDTGSYPVGAAEQPLYIDSVVGISSGSVFYPRSETVQAGTLFASNGVRLVFSGLIPSGTMTGVVETRQNEDLTGEPLSSTLTIVSIEGNAMVVKADNVNIYDYFLDKIKITIGTDTFEVVALPVDEETHE